MVIGQVLLHHFNLYIRNLIFKLRDKGCYLFNQFAMCTLFADDIILLTRSLIHIEEMLSVCYKYGIEMGGYFV